MHSKNWPESLVKHRHLSSEALSYAQNLALTHNTPLEEVLIRYGYLNYKTLYRHIAYVSGHEYGDLFAKPVDKSIINSANISFYQTRSLIPWKKQNHIVFLATSCLTEEICTWAKQNYTNFTFVITSPRDIAWSIKQLMREEDLSYIQERLLTHHPDYSCKTIAFAMNHYKTLSGLALFITLLCYYGYFVVPLYFLLNVLCIFNNFFKLFLSLIGLHVKRKKFSLLSV